VLNNGAQTTTCYNSQNNAQGASSRSASQGALLKNNKSSKFQIYKSIFVKIQIIPIVYNYI
jgi:hypothetical protein